MTTHRIRVGIDVGGTFTDAVAVDATTLELLGQVKVPTSHHHEDGVAHGIVEALDRLLEQTGRAAEDVAFLAHGTTQATNALLEGDVATVGLIGIGTGPGAVLTRRLASLGRLELAPGKRLPLAYAHVADPEDPDEVRTAVDTVTRDGAQVLVASEPFGVDRPEGEQAVLDAARPRGLPMTAAHEITSLYGLAKRTRTAVVNAAILPRMLATADLVDASITKAGVNAPLMVMRCDGGVMSLDEMRRRPLLTVLSGPAAGVAGALMQERISEGLFLETGGTSTDISVVRRGKVAVRHATILGKASYLSALDVRTVGVGGGSMVRIDGGKVVGVGPRSAHIAGLPYACFATLDELRDARIATVRPMDGDPDDYAVIDAAGGRYAITMTCAANALGRVPEDDFARCDQDVARAALAPLAAALSTDVATAAARLLDAGTEQVRAVTDAMIRDYRLEKDTAVLVGGGGGAASVTPHLASVTGQEGRIARHSEVISPIGVALALVREQIERIIPGAGQEQILAVRAEAEAAVVAQGAAADGVEVEVTVDPQTSTVRAVATGATELRTQDRAHRADGNERLRAAAASLKADPADVSILATTPAHTVYGTEVRRRFRATRRPVRVVDADGVVRLHAPDALVETTTVAAAPETLARLVGEATSYGDGGVRAPALRLLLGSRIADLSGVLDPQPLLALARSELGTRAADEPVVAVVEART
ncbi:hydantoinase/oxoprolinase family protein [Streptomyces sp. NBC_00257]|uniref:hydantoinase/oxoprolinase family protein n=1 Tax=unclassified Streptomyces TaxID=2593676 RepID=UPI002250D439|nr:MULTISPECIES: hydantoinase/oxoprolinase family protein [unclassified Streptomyces]WTB58791.1 hydantoinase/oxoprolinase family protein [Streptomyces sp. NBC_00826]WTH88331.1 hydantoinase/oxoprolinase family protein [Streptomyces sp. NBC_00825]WTH97059.1 hydantoinase/oxoprolinase family protein [Streptomyces sp. NBC_00822]MCX4862549.1 hydantoinase/oxoprolinase family protein [Streptomyces sp. NBC_00906]MCX4893786.1 hydantoinase/oxoprolinase family protein [Streptomyces sp. NBC_00892]